MTGKAVGVIGGMGPAATTAFIERLQALTPAKADQDHLRLFIDCNPHVFDRNAALAGTGPSPGPVLASMAQGLERSGAELLAMPCNAAHAWAGEIRAATRLPLVDLIDAAADDALSASKGPVGVLAADACLSAGLYQRALGARGADHRLLGEDDQRRFMDLLYAIKAGRLEEARGPMRGLAERLIEAGAGAILAGCTEVPLVLGPDDLPVPFVDSLEALARRTLAEALATVDA
ncbi:MAG: aspartate/glutamate racemase family protein [Caulobacteraceae bacterium]